MAILTENIGSTFVYISTAGIFDGNKESYDDFDKPNPINVYGSSKYKGELFVQRQCFKLFHISCRLDDGIRSQKR